MCTPLHPPACAQGERQYWGVGEDGTGGDPRGVREVSRACALEDEIRTQLAGRLPAELVARLDTMQAAGGPAPPPPGAGPSARVQDSVGRRSKEGAGRTLALHVPALLSAYILASECVPQGPPLSQTGPDVRPEMAGALYCSHPVSTPQGWRS